MKDNVVNPDIFQVYLESLGGQTLRNGKVVFHDPRPSCHGYGKKAKLEFDFRRMSGWCYYCNTKFSVVDMVTLFDPKFKENYSGAFHFAKNGFSVSALPDEEFVNVDATALESSQERFGDIGSSVVRERKIVSSLPEGFLSLKGNSDSFQVRMAEDYLRRRKIPLKRAWQMEIGVSPKYPWIGRLVMPVRNFDGDLVMITSRSYTEVFGYESKSHIDGDKTTLYGIHLAKRFKVGVLVEGMTDVLANPSFFVCSFGKTLSHEQIMELERWNPDKLFLMYDPDAISEAYGVATQLKNRSSFKSDLFFCNLPPNLDPGSAGWPTVWSSLENSDYLEDVESVMMASLFTT